MEGSREKLIRERKLYEASLSGSVDSLNELMKEDELILARVCVTCFGETPLHIASMLGHLAFVIEILRHKPDLLTQCDSQRFSPLHVASGNGYIEIVKKLLVVNTSVCLFRDEDGRTPLHLAVMKGQIEVISELVRARPEVIKYKLNRGETVLHSCVKHNRLDALKLLVEPGRVDDLINVKDDDGFTILHMASALKQMETIKYLLDTTRVEVNAVNGNGFTALDIIEQMPRDFKVMEIRESLLNAGVLRAENLPAAASSTHQTNQVTAAAVNSNVLAPPSDVHPTVAIGRPQKHTEYWLEKKRDALMVAASVIAAMAYQAGLNPPGGVWQQDGPIGNDGHPVYLTGESTMAHQRPHEYPLFLLINTVSFVASLSIVLLLVSGIPMKRRIFVWILMVAMWVTLTFMTYTYLYSMFAISPSRYLRDSSFGSSPPQSQDISPSQDLLNTRITLHVIRYSLYAWIGLIGIIFLVHTVRFLIWCIRMVINLVMKCFSCCTTQGRGRGRGQGPGPGNV